MVAVALPHKRHAALDRMNLFQSSHNFVVAWRIKRNRRTTRRNRTQNGNAFVAFVFPELVFLFILEKRTDRDWNRSDAEARTADGQPPEASSGCQAPSCEQDAKGGGLHPCHRASLFRQAKVDCPSRTLFFPEELTAEMRRPGACLATASRSYRVSLDKTCGFFRLRRKNHC